MNQDIHHVSVTLIQVSILKFKLSQTLAQDEDVSQPVKSPESLTPTLSI